MDIFDWDASTASLKLQGVETTLSLSKTIIFERILPKIWGKKKKNLSYTWVSFVICHDQLLVTKVIGNLITGATDNKYLVNPLAS